MTQQWFRFSLVNCKKHLSEKTTEQPDTMVKKKTQQLIAGRMNLLLHGFVRKIEYQKWNTLGQDWPEDPERPNEGVQFDAVVMKILYSIINWNRSD